MGGDVAIVGGDTETLPLDDDALDRSESADQLVAGPGQIGTSRLGFGQPHRAVQSGDVEPMAARVDHPLEPDAGRDIGTVPPAEDDHRIPARHPLEHHPRRVAEPGGARVVDDRGQGTVVVETHHDGPIGEAQRQRIEVVEQRRHPPGEPQLGKALDQHVGPGLTQRVGRRPTPDAGNQTDAGGPRLPHPCWPVDGHDHVIRRDVESGRGGRQQVGASPLVGSATRRPLAQDDVEERCEPRATQPLGKVMAPGNACQPESATLPPLEGPDDIVDER